MGGRSTTNFFIPTSGSAVQIETVGLVPVAGFQSLKVLNFTTTGTAAFGSTATAQTVFVAANGTAAAPSYAFTNSTGTGLFRSGTDILGVSTAGVSQWNWNAAGTFAGSNSTTGSDLMTLTNTFAGAARGLLVTQGATTTGAGVTVSMTSGAAGNALALTGNTATISVPVISATQTWNAGGVTFDGLLANFTSTASATGSRLLNLQLGGNSALNILKAGTVNVVNAAIYGWSSSATDATAALDTGVSRLAANSIAFGNGAAADRSALLSGVGFGFGTGTAASGQITGSSATVTVSTPILNLSQTWNAAVTFEGMLFNATSTSSNTASRLLNLQLGGNSSFNVLKAGTASVVSGAFVGWTASATDATAALDTAIARNGIGITAFTLGSGTAGNGQVVANSLWANNNLAAPINQGFTVTNAPYMGQRDATAYYVLSAAGTSQLPVLAPHASRGTHASPLALVSGDTVFACIAYGAKSATAFAGAGEIDCAVDGTPATGTPGAWIFYTSAAGSATQVKQWSIRSTGNLSGNSAVVMGWVSSATDPVTALDTGLSRDAAGVIDFGTGTAASTAGSWKATNGTLLGGLSIGPTAGTITAGQAIFGTGGGVITQLLGPSDQVFKIAAASPASSGGGNGLTLAAAAATTSGAAGPVSVLGGNSAGTNSNGAKAIIQSGLPTGNGITNNDVVLRTGFPLTSSTTVQTAGDRVYVSGNSKILSNTSATTTTFVLLSTTTGSTVGGTIWWVVETNDGTDWQSFSGTGVFALVNKAGTLTANGGDIVGNSTNAVSAGTIAATMPVTTSGTSIALQIRPVWTVIVPTLVRISYTILSFGPTTVTPQ